MEYNEKLAKLILGSRLNNRDLLKLGIVDDAFGDSSKLNSYYTTRDSALNDILSKNYQANEAEKARQFQAQQALENRQFQAAENAKNRAVQEAYNKSLKTDEARTEYLNILNKKDKTAADLERLNQLEKNFENLDVKNLKDKQLGWEKEQALATKKATDKENNRKEQALVEMASIQDKLNAAKTREEKQKIANDILSPYAYIYMNPEERQDMFKEATGLKTIGEMNTEAIKSAVASHQGKKTTEGLTKKDLETEVSDAIAQSKAPSTLSSEVKRTIQRNYKWTGSEWKAK